MTLPGPLQWLWDRWMQFSHGLGLVMSSILLSIMWLLGVGIYGIVWKIGGLFSNKKSVQTYWLPLAPSKPDDMRHPF